MELELILSFLGASIILTLMPGPDNIFVLTESVTKGTKFGIMISLGLITGVLVHITAAATGISIIVQESESLFNTIRFLGVGYILYLTALVIKEEYLYIKSKRRGEDENISKEKIATTVVVGESPFYPFKLFNKGVIMNILNPKVSLFFIAFLPQFTRPPLESGGYSVLVQMLILGVLFILQGLLIFISLSFLAGMMNRLLKRASFWRLMRWIQIVLFLVIALILIIK